MRATWIRIGWAVSAALAGAAILGGCSAEESASEQTAWPALAPMVRPEHPRPDFRRDSFVNLNTVWDFAYDPDDLGVASAWFSRDDVWTDRIQVPYAWESPLSGLVAPHEGPYSLFDTLRASTYRGVGWYRLRIPEPLPSTPGLDWYVVFGAVDFHATVWVNGVQLGEHTGGYDPFSVALSSVAPGERLSIVVRAEDATELNGRAQPVGKQGGTWYTRTSGIWQTVYLEQRPATHLSSVRLVPHLDTGELEVIPRISTTQAVTVRLNATLAGNPAGAVESTVDPSAGGSLRLALSDVQPWDHDTPVLYDLDVEVEAAGQAADVVHTYFGMATTGRGWLPGHSPADVDDPLEQVQSFQVNGQPRYLRCVLDQSYWPDGIYTAPSEDAIRADLEIAREHGFNCIRLHIKPDEPIKYRLLDELGFYVVYDIPSLDLQAKNEQGFPGRQYFEQTMRAAIERDANHPGIVEWVIFNENWGLIENGSMASPTLLADSPDLQQWVTQMVGLARQLDPTRPVEDNSAGGIVERFEHIDSDSNSFHYYGDEPGAYRTFLDEQAALTFPGSTANFVGGGVQDGAPWWNSEVASFSTLGGGEGEKLFCDLFGLFNEMRRAPKLTGFVLTQLTDVEYELNGLVTYDRRAKAARCERDGVGLADLFGDDFIAFDWLPGEGVDAAAPSIVPLRFAQWSSSEPAQRTLRVAWVGGASAEQDLQTIPYEPVLVEAEIPAPPQAGPAVLVAEVRDGSGKRLCANRLEVMTSVARSR